MHAVLPTPPRLVLPLARANHAISQRQSGHGLVGVGVGDGQAQGVGGVRAGVGQLEQTFHHFLNLAFVPTFAVDVLAAYRQAVYDARS